MCDFFRFASCSKFVVCTWKLMLVISVRAIEPQGTVGCDWSTTYTHLQVVMLWPRIRKGSTSRRVLILEWCEHRGVVDWLSVSLTCTRMTVHAICHVSAISWRVCYQDSSVVVVKSVEYWRLIYHPAATSWFVGLLLSVDVTVFTLHHIVYGETCFFIWTGTKVEAVYIKQAISYVFPASGAVWA